MSHLKPLSIFGEPPLCISYLLQAVKNKEYFEFKTILYVSKSRLSFNLSETLVTLCEVQILSCAIVIWDTKLVKMGPPFKCTGDTENSKEELEETYMLTATP